MNIEYYESQDLDTKIKLLSEFKIRRKKYLKRLRTKGIKARNLPMESLKKIILIMDKIEDIKSITKIGGNT